MRGNEKDRFLFYDAFALFRQTIDITWDEGVTLENTGDAVQFAYAIRVRKGKCSFARFGRLEKKTTAKLEEVDRKIAQLEEIRGALYELIAACPGSGALRVCSIMEALVTGSENRAARSASRSMV